jgi:hypothetical protein
VQVISLFSLFHGFIEERPVKPGDNEKQSLSESSRISVFPEPRLKNHFFLTQKNQGAIVSEEVISKRFPGIGLSKPGYKINKKRAYLPGQTKFLTKDRNRRVGQKGTFRS